MTNVNEIIVPKNGYANLINDYMFKRVFGSEECKDILISFLNHVLDDKKVEDVMKEPHECYLFAKAEDPSSPIILHFPLVNRTFRTHLAPGEGSLGLGLVHRALGW